MKSFLLEIRKRHCVQVLLIYHGREQQYLMLGVDRSGDGAQLLVEAAVQQPVRLVVQLIES